MEELVHSLTDWQQGERENEDEGQRRDDTPVPVGDSGNFAVVLRDPYMNM
jgi:hypothetical protein